jgi:hypothetical protein
MSDLPSEEVTTHPLDGGEPNGAATNDDLLNKLLIDGEDDPLTKLILENEANEKAQKAKEEKVKKVAEGMSDMPNGLPSFSNLTFV